MTFRLLFRRCVKKTLVVEPSLFISNLFQLDRPRFVESARPNKLNRSLKFELVKPRPVGFADVHD